MSRQRLPRREKTESSEERRKKKNHRRNAENSRSDQSEACGEEKWQSDHYPLKQKRVNYPGRASVALPAKRKQRVH
ncbi:hypothetical protein DMI62_15865 [Escherichia coli]|nr:hypothetical protein [Escherichia coli]